jgi:hypothetical protein
VHRINKKEFLKILDTQREIPSRSPSLSWSACIGRKERKENWQGLGYAWPNSNSNLSSFEKVLKTY